MNRTIEELRQDVLAAAQELAALDVQLRVAEKLAAAAHIRYAGVRSELEAALSESGLAALRERWREQEIPRWRA